MSYDVWGTPDRGRSPHRPPDLQLNPRHAQLLRCLLETRAWTMDLISCVVVQHEDTCMDMISHCLWECYEACTMSDRGGSPHISPYDFQLQTRICSDVMKSFLAKSLNYRPCQWCSGQMMMIPVWTCYPTVIWVVYMRQGAMSDRGGPPHRPQYDFQLHPGHAQLLPWILEQGAWNIPVL